MADGIPGVAYFEQVLKMQLEEIIRFPFHSFNWPIVVYKVWFRTYFLLCCIHPSEEECCMIFMLIKLLARLNDENLFKKIICILGIW